MRRFVSLALLLVIAPCSAALGQRLTVIAPFETPRLDSSRFGILTRASLEDSRTSAGDYRFEGTVAGGLLLGAFGFWIGTQACRNEPVPASSGGSSCSAAPVGLVGVALGSGLGYVLGRLTPKHR
jgi:hypothetical protein